MYAVCTVSQHILARTSYIYSHLAVDRVPNNRIMSNRIQNYAHHHLQQMNHVAYLLYVQTNSCNTVTVQHHVQRLQYYVLDSVSQPLSLGVPHLKLHGY